MYIMTSFTASSGPGSRPSFRWRRYTQVYVGDVWQPYEASTLQTLTSDAYVVEAIHAPVSYSTLAIFLDTRLRSETLHTWQAPDMESGYEAFSQNMG
jgi:hypothetical protein